MYWRKKKKKKKKEKKRRKRKKKKRRKRKKNTYRGPGPTYIQRRLMSKDELKRKKIYVNKRSVPGC